MGKVRAALSRRSDEWNDDDLDVLTDDGVVGDIFQRTITSRRARLRRRRSPNEF
jgi:hypothetical protein